MKSVIILYLFLLACVYLLGNLLFCCFGFILLENAWLIFLFLAWACAWSSSCPLISVNAFIRSSSSQNHSTCLAFYFVFTHHVWLFPCIDKLDRLRVRGSPDLDRLKLRGSPENVEIRSRSVRDSPDRRMGGQLRYSCHVGDLTPSRLPISKRQGNCDRFFCHTLCKGCELNSW